MSASRIFRTASLALRIALAMAAGACGVQAGILGWFTSKPCEWERVQRTGGVQISAPIQHDGKTVLPVTQNVCRFDSALTVRKIEATRSGQHIVIRIFTQLVEKDRPPAASRVDLSGFPKGCYQVYYEIAGDPERLLGTVEIP